MTLNWGHNQSDSEVGCKIVDRERTKAGCCCWLLVVRLMKYDIKQESLATFHHGNTSICRYETAVLSSPPSATSAGENVLSLFVSTWEVGSQCQWAVTCGLVRGVAIHAALAPFLIL